MNNSSGLDYFPDCKAILTTFWKHALFKYQLPISTRLIYLQFTPLDIYWSSIASVLVLRKRLILCTHKKWRPFLGALNLVMMPKTFFDSHNVICIQRLHAEQWPNKALVKKILKLIWALTGLICKVGTPLPFHLLKTLCSVYCLNIRKGANERDKQFRCFVLACTTSSYVTELCSFACWVLSHTKTEEKWYFS